MAETLMVLGLEVVVMALGRDVWEWLVGLGASADRCGGFEGIMTEVGECIMIGVGLSTTVAAVLAVVVGVVGGETTGTVEMGVLYSSTKV